MKYKFEKNILHRIKYDKPILPIHIQNEIDSLMYSCEYNIATKITNKVDEAILETLYNEYLDSGYDELIILDKTEFEHFILKYLPIYLKERN